MKLTIFYTNICNIYCKHCFLGEQKVKKIMDNRMLKNILGQINELNISKICFSGGEPLLFWNNIKTVLEDKILRRNIKISFSSNGYWAKTLNSALYLCSELKSYNIIDLEISYDIFHATFIPLLNIKNIVDACKVYAINLKIIMSVSNDLRYLKVYADMIKMIDKKHIILQQVASFGNAKANNLDCNLFVKQFTNIKCNQILNPCVTYSGNVFACCGPCVANNYNSNLFLGNLKNHSLKILIETMQTNNTFINIKKYGPFKFLQSEIDIEKCSSLCELCEKIKL